MIEFPTEKRAIQQLTDIIDVVIGKARRREINLNENYVEGSPHYESQRELLAEIDFASRILNFSIGGSYCAFADTPPIIDPRIADSAVATLERVKSITHQDSQFYNNAAGRIQDILDYIELQKEWNPAA